MIRNWRIPGTVSLLILATLVLNLVRAADFDSSDGIFTAVDLTVKLSKQQKKEIQTLQEQFAAPLASLREQALAAYLEMQTLVSDGVVTGPELMTATRNAMTAIDGLVTKRLEVVAALKPLLSAEQWKQFSLALTLDDLTVLVTGHDKAKGIGGISGSRQSLSRQSISGR